MTRLAKTRAPESEREILQAIRIELGRRPDCLVFRNSVGVAQHDGRKQRFGLAKGSCDLVGIVTMPLDLDPISGAHLPRAEPARGEKLGPHLVGRWFGLEVKTATGRVSPEQTMFLQLVRRFGGFGAVVRSVNEAVDAVERCKAGASE